MIPFCFCVNALVLWLQATLYPELPILAAAPLLALVCLDIPQLTRALLWSASAGFMLDLFSSDPLGLHALTYALAAFACIQLRRPFSSEAPIQFALYTALMSAVVSSIQLILLFLFDRRGSFPGRWWLTEGLCLPLFDGVYALLWFAGPLALYRTLHKLWTLHWLKKKNADTP